MQIWCYNLYVNLFIFFFSPLSPFTPFFTQGAASKHYVLQQRHYQVYFQQVFYPGYSICPKKKDPVSCLWLSTVFITKVELFSLSSTVLWFRASGTVLPGVPDSGGSLFPFSRQQTSLQECRRSDCLLRRSHAYPQCPPSWFHQPIHLLPSSLWLNKVPLIINHRA